MKVVFIIPKEDGQYSQGQYSDNSRLFPPVSLAPMNRLVGKYHSRFLIDERKTSGRHHDDANIVIIFTNVYNQENSNALANRYHSRGSYVIFTGPNLTSCMKFHNTKADTVFIGSGEQCLGNFLSDYQDGSVQAVYQKSQTSPMSDLQKTMELSLAS